MAFADPAVGGGRRILVVEDEYLVASHLTMILEDSGFTVIGPVATLVEATTALAAEAVDGVLLDANLGGTSSAPIAAALVIRRLPFVVVTGYGDLELPGEALQAARRIHKPFDPTRVRTMLVAALAEQ